MRTLHIAPGHSAGGSLRQAVRDDGRDEEVLFFRDDLSCGPIASDDLAARVAWWTRYYGDDWETEAALLKDFWDRVAKTDDRLVVWFGRHSAMELAFYLAWADRLKERPYSIIDVTGLRLPSNRPDGSRLSKPTPAVGVVPPYQLGSLFGSEQQVSAQEAGQASRQWRQLRAENAPFRVVTPAGLVSAPIDHFDLLLMERVTTEWRKVQRVIGDAMGLNLDPYLQVGDTMLLARVVALVDEGRLLAEGDPWDMHSCRVRLPQ